VVTSERLVKVTMVSTIMFATFTVPSLPMVIYLDIMKYDPPYSFLLGLDGYTLSPQMFQYFLERFSKSYRKPTKYQKIDRDAHNKQGTASNATIFYDLKNGRIISIDYKLRLTEIYVFLGIILYCKIK
jgi:hypothetical protein